MTVDKASQEPFHCSHCESLGEVTFSCFQREHQNSSVKVWVRNLPVGISESGVKNLFIAIGKPISISYNAKSRIALVVFEYLKYDIPSNEAELAVRDLHCTPPYNLKVSIASTRYQRGDKKSKEENESKSDDVWDFSKPQNPTDPVEDDTQECNNTKMMEVVKQIGNVIKNIHYDPSIRMRQKKLDFKTDVECVSRGRGYIYMGKRDNFVGGLQKFESVAPNSKARDEMRFSCENCKALTTKICGRCSASYCSKLCLRTSSIDHIRGCTSNSNVDGYPIRTHSNSQASQLSYSQVPLTSGCVVVMSTYFTMQTVVVRRTDEPWEDRFSRLCNDVAAEAFKGGNLEEIPKVGDVVIARYHEDLCYYRAQVLSQDKDKINLIFLDFGNTQETNVNDLKPLSEGLKSLPPLAVKVHLKDVSNESTLESVKYYNALTADRVPLILNYDEGASEVVLIEKESKGVVNKTVTTYAMPSWKKDESVLSKLGDIFYLNSLERQTLEVGTMCNLILSHFDEKEFLESEVFWATNPEADDFFHANSQMYLRIKEYCEFLKNDAYLPRTNELCLAREGGEWHRCVNLKSHKTTCCLFFLDDGHSSFINTNNIRKMIADFTEVPSQAICCTLPDDPKLKTDKELQSKAVDYLKASSGQTIESVAVLKLMGDAYCLSVPEINRILSRDK